MKILMVLVDNDSSIYNHLRVFFYVTWADMTFGGITGYDQAYWRGGPNNLYPYPFIDGPIYYYYLPTKSMLIRMGDPL